MDAAREALRRDDDALDLSIGMALNALIAEAEQITRRAFVNRAMRVSLAALLDATGSFLQSAKDDSQKWQERLNGSIPKSGP